MEFASVDVDDERELPALKTPFVSSRRLLAHLGCLSNAREVAELRAGHGSRVLVRAGVLAREPCTSQQARERGQGCDAGYNV